MIPEDKVKELQELHKEYVRLNKEWNGGHGDTDALPKIWDIKEKMTNLIFRWYIERSK
jgi:hypothetical protein